MSFQRISNLPSGTILCGCVQDEIKYFGTSTGAVYIVDDNALSRSSQLPGHLRGVASGPIRKQGSTVFCLNTLKNNF